MKVSKADVATGNATSYLKQLCRHWSHRFNVEFDDERGTIQLPQTVCRLEATPEVLTIQLDAQDNDSQSRMEAVVAEHLQRFGFRETLVFRWNRQ